MPSESKPLGIMKPMGGGDPIPLRKAEVTVGRRPTCDIQLDFENVSGKHCVLKLVSGVWHVRDLGSTNGTSVNGQRITNEHGLMPDDELGVATHYYHIDYDPVAPLQTSKMVLEGELSESQPRKQRSLMELAGLSTDEDRPSRRPRPARASEREERPAPREAEFDDVVPDRFPAAPSPKAAPDDDDFFRLIEEDVKQKD